MLGWMMDLLTPEAAETSEARPYHHGDLQRALVEAAQRILDRDGLQALSLRAVAREAGVSPAAPYHHFKDKAELLDAVGAEAFHALAAAMREAREAEPDDALTAMGVAYVVFARENPPRYRVMWDCSRDKDAMPHEKEAGGEPTAYDMVRNELIRSGAVAADDELGAEIATCAMWTAVHGLAEMANFSNFDPLKEALGGERAFYRAMLSNIGHLRGL